jgi:hypothetical protein
VVAIVEHPAADPVLPEERDQAQSRRTSDLRAVESGASDTP